MQNYSKPTENKLHNQYWTKVKNTQKDVLFLKENCFSIDIIDNWLLSLYKLLSVYYTILNNKNIYNNNFLIRYKRKHLLFKLYTPLITYLSVLSKQITDSVLLVYLSSK